FLFFGGRKGDLNIKGAFLHMAAEAVVSAGVVIAGIAIIWTNLSWIDPATSLLVAIVILIGTWGLLRDSTNLALQAVPDGQHAHLRQSGDSGCRHRRHFRRVCRPAGNRLLEGRQIA
ncbi:MAG: cation transporter, partial [Candidatus Zixiibacteriota bacterium]